MSLVREGGLYMFETIRGCSSIYVCFFGAFIWDGIWLSLQEKKKKQDQLHLGMEKQGKLGSFFFMLVFFSPFLFFLFFWILISINL